MDEEITIKLKLNDMEKRKPIGFVAICQCGEKIGAMDFTRMDKKDAGKLLGQWLESGCTVEPRFESGWIEHITVCRCAEYKRTTNTD